MGKYSSRQIHNLVTIECLNERVAKESFLLMDRQIAQELFVFIGACEL